MFPTVVGTFYQANFNSDLVYFILTVERIRTFPHFFFSHFQKKLKTSKHKNKEGRSGQALPCRPWNMIMYCLWKFRLRSVPPHDNFYLICCTYVYWWEIHWFDWFYLIIDFFSLNHKKGNYTSIEQIRVFYLPMLYRKARSV